MCSITKSIKRKGEIWYWMYIKKCHGKGSRPIFFEVWKILSSNKNASWILKNYYIWEECIVLSAMFEVSISKPWENCGFIEPSK